MLNGSDQTSLRSVIWSAVLSSSIVLAGLTGMLYLVGGTEYQTRMQSLGVKHLAGLQPTDYIFVGGQQLFLIIGILMAAMLPLPFVAISDYRKIVASLQHRIGPRLERWLFLIPPFGCFLLIAELLLAETRAPNLLTSTICAAQSQYSRPPILLTGFIIAVVVALLTPVFRDRRHRLSFLFLSLFFFLFLAFAIGEKGGLYAPYESSFDVAEIRGLSFLPDPASVASAVILASDATNIAIMLKGEAVNGHATPRYVQRSELKNFRVVGQTSLTNFFCKNTSR